jgi:hypothetical protein
MDSIKIEFMLWFCLKILIKFAAFNKTSPEKIVGGVLRDVVHTHFT